MFVYVWQVQVREFAALIIMLGGFFSFKKFFVLFRFFFRLYWALFRFLIDPNAPYFTIMFVAFLIKYNCYKQYYKAHLALRQCFVPVASLAICLHECMNGHVIFNHVIRYQSLCFLPLTLNTDVVSTMYIKTTQNKNGTSINRS